MIGELETNKISVVFQRRVITLESAALTSPSIGLRGIMNSGICLT